MRIKFHFLSVILIIAVLGACKTTEHKLPSKEIKGTPQQVAECFFKYLGDLRFDEARQLATEKTIKTINFVETLSQLGGGGQIILHDNKSECTGCMINNDEAICSYRTYSGGEQKVYLLKQKGRWKVDLRKDVTEKK
ncbi:MAG: hypothetical protein WCM76_03665 [Bacteroidota bacterium]